MNLAECGAKISAMKNYYTVLGVPSRANEQALRQAFRAKARRFHPDTGPGSSAERFREVMEAYETLSDPVRRRKYDRSLGQRASEVEPLIPPAEPLHARVRYQSTGVADIFDVVERILAEFDASFDAPWNRF